jgi:hypothetical protein
LKRKRTFGIIVLFIVMTKICKKCGVDKPLNEYHKSKAFTDGLNSSCGICVNEYNSNRNKEKRRTTIRDKSNVFFRLSNTPQKDYCSMFEFISVIGYDLNKDIHKQFCIKYNLPYKKREAKSKNKYTHTDCIKTDE